MTAKAPKPSAAKPVKTPAHGRPVDRISKGRAEPSGEELTKANAGDKPWTDFWPASGRQ